MAKKPKTPFLSGSSAFASYMERELYASYRYSAWDLWDAWLRHLLASIQQDEEAFEKAASRCPEALPAFKEWGEALLEAFRNSPLEDHLGTAYMACGRGNSHMGQFFTPMPVARMMAEMNFHDIDTLECVGPVVTACEPSAGSGVMILASEQARRSRPGAKPIAWWSADLDETCCRMTAIQCALSEIPALVLACDSLRFGMTPAETAVLIHPAITDPRVGRVRVITHAQANQIFDHIQDLALELSGEVAVAALPRTGT